MSLPVPASSTISAAGTTIAWELPDGIAIVAVGDSTLTRETTCNVPGTVGVSPSGDFVAVADAREVTVLGAHHDWGSVASWPIEEQPFRLAVADDGFVAAVLAAEDDDASSLVLLDERDREAIALGDMVPFTLLVDGEHDRILLAGQSGPGAFNGGGEAQVRLLACDEVDGRWRTIWNGPDDASAINGWVMPLSFGDIGSYTSDRLSTISPTTNPDEIGIVVERYDWSPLETVVASPDGGWVAWYWSDAETSTLRVRAARLADGQVVDHPSVDVESFPVIAVDDDGAVTLADTRGRSELRVRWLRDGGTTEASLAV